MTASKKIYKGQQREGLAGARFIIGCTAAGSGISWTSEREEKKKPHKQQTGGSGATIGLVNHRGAPSFLTVQIQSSPKVAEVS